MRWYDRDGHPCDDWAELDRLRADAAYRVVDRTKIMDAADPTVSWEVSTVWVGLDHRYDGVGPPLIFETAVFAEGTSSDAAARRYSTGAEAEAGHREMVTTVAATLTNPIVLDWSLSTGPAAEA